MRENDVASIRLQYKKFLEAWECGNENLLDTCVTELPFAYVSMYGHAYNLDQIKKWFKNPGPEGSEFRIIPLQDTILTKENEAQQYAVVLGMITSGEEHIAFGGSFMNHYEKTESGWVLEQIRFQLQSDDGMKREWLDEEGIVHRELGRGNRNLLGEWLGVDERVGAFQDKIEHSGELMITPELDAPWRVIKKPDNTMNDEEAIKDVLCRVTAAYDFLAMMLAVPAFHECASIDIGGMFGTMNKRETLGYLKEFRRALPRSFSGVVIDSLNIENNHAYAVVSVWAPEAYQIGKESPCFIKDSYEVEFEKKKESWTILQIKPHIV